MDLTSVAIFIFLAYIAHKITSGWGKKGKSKGNRGRSRSKPGFIRRLFGKKKSGKSSWYWGNKRWTGIRDRRKEENTSRYGLPSGTCRCERCGNEIKGKSIHIDHIYPRKHFPALQYSYWNTQVLCSKCNLKKSDKPGYNWRRMRQWGLHILVWFLRYRQVKNGLRS